MIITRAKAKPIFKEEKEFIESKLNLKLPDNCWIDGGYKIYMVRYILKSAVIKI